MTHIGDNEGICFTIAILVVKFIQHMPWTAVSSPGSIKKDKNIPTGKRGSVGSRASVPRQ